MVSSFLRSHLSNFSWGRTDLKTAQREIAADWIGAYQKYVAKQPRAPGRAGGGRAAAKVVGDLDLDADGQPDLDEGGDGAPALVPAAPAQRQPGADARPDTATGRTMPTTTAGGQVWVNTKSGVIWRPGSRYYGKTKEGKYMSGAEAKAAGYHFAAGQ